MYVPFLFGRANELLALRDLSEIVLPRPLSPTIEAVNADPGPVTRALTMLAAAGVSASVVANPSALASTRPGTRTTWETAVLGSAAFANMRPALSLDATTTLSEVRAFAGAYVGRSMTFVARSGVIPPSDLAKEVSGLDALVQVHHNLAVADYDAAFGADRVIALTNSFTPQPRNVDYGADDWFSAASTTFGSAGRPGFGDYTLLDPTVKSTRGGAPGAVVIHATYIDSAGALWVRHYLSDSVIQGEVSSAEKLLEAMAKLQHDRPMFLDSPGMKAYDHQYATGWHTGLGTNKRQQISHHIYTTLASMP